MGLWHSGTSQESFDTATISANTKYHVVVTLDGVNKICYVWVYNLSNATLYSYSKTFTNTLRIIDSDFRIGTDGNLFNGVIDEVVVLNRMVNEIEAVKIRFGAYSGENQLDVVATQAYVEYQEESETKISQVVAEVEWVPTDPNTHLYAGSIGIGIAVQGSYDPVWEKTGSVPIGMTPPGNTSLYPPQGNLSITAASDSITPDADYARGFAFRARASASPLLPRPNISSLTTSMKAPALK